MSESSQTYPTLFFHFLLAILLKSTFSHNGITALKWDRGQGCARYAHSRSQYYEQGTNACGHQHSVAQKSQPCTNRLLKVWLACETLSKAFVRLVGGGFFFLTSDLEKNKTELDHSWWYAIQDKGTSIASQSFEKLPATVERDAEDWRLQRPPRPLCSLFSARHHHCQ